MTLVGGIAIYFVLWWLVLFTVLPWGATSAHELGQEVEAGQTVVVLEAMKMENNINAHRDGVVTTIGFAAGDVVESGAVLAHIESTGDRVDEDDTTGA